MDEEMLAATYSSDKTCIVERIALRLFVKLSTWFRASLRASAT
jgi:hypothetical protein